MDRKDARQPASAKDAEAWVWVWAEAGAWALAEEANNIVTAPDMDTAGITAAVTDTITMDIITPQLTSILTTKNLYRLTRRSWRRGLPG